MAGGALPVNGQYRHVCNPHTDTLPAMSGLFFAQILSYAKSPSRKRSQEALRSH
ncbi:hypothetical protein [Enterobacter kobei]|uniref:hypothetical protein n=1 Tax=Enterobacter kobei TaxID=208224 RepID=UPI00031B06EA|nr:hypothetical protein [Enterobacter kobei]